jgi:hypothetical protein
MIAAALRDRAAFSGQMSDSLAQAIEPANMEEGILKIALVQGDHKSFMLNLADYFDGAAVLGSVIDLPLPEVPTLAAAVAQDAVAGMAVNQAAAEPMTRFLESYEEIQEGDEWRLRDGLRHRDDRPVEWRPCGGSVGNLVSDYPDSIFRRKA